MKHEEGFSLVELVIVITIVAIMASLASTSFRGVTSINRVSSEVNSFVGDLQFARAEAVKRGLPVTLCASLDGATCSGTTSFGSGWIVFNDVNANGAVDSGEAVLRVREAFSFGAKPDTMVASGSTSYVTFNREGFVSAGGSTLFTLHDASNTAAYTRCLSLMLVGRAQIQKAGVGSCA